MKVLFLGLTLLVHFAIAVTVRASGYFYWLISVVLFSMLIGFVLKRNGTSIRAKELGWGMFFGSITSISLMVLCLVGILIAFHGMTC